MEGEHIRIVLLGKTGSGKSSLANTLFGEKDLFKVGCAAISETKLCKSETKTIHGRSLQLIDTPGLFDTDPDCPELSPELLRCVIECAPGPHAFLLMMQVGRFTKHEQDVVDLSLKTFSEEALKFTTVVFTHGDQLDKGQEIEQWVKKNKALDDLVQKCEGRCHVFDNKYWNKSKDKYRNNQKQITQLLKTIDQTVRRNNQGYYTNEKLQEAHEEIEKEKVSIKKSSPNISKAELIAKAKNAAYKKLLKTGLITLAALLGGALGVAGTVVLAPAAAATAAVVAVGAAASGAGATVSGVSAALVSWKIELATKKKHQ